MRLIVFWFIKIFSQYILIILILPQDWFFLFIVLPNISSFVHVLLFWPLLTSPLPSSGSLSSFMTGIKRHLPEFHRGHLSSCNQREKSWSGTLSGLMMCGWIIHNLGHLGKLNEFLLGSTRRRTFSQLLGGYGLIKAIYVLGELQSLPRHRHTQNQSDECMFCWLCVASHIRIQRSRVLLRGKGFQREGDVWSNLKRMLMITLSWLFQRVSLCQSSCPVRVMTLCDGMTCAYCHLI